jgi:cytoskeletal protein RodZ
MKIKISIVLIASAIVALIIYDFTKGPLPTFDPSSSEQKEQQNFSNSESRTNDSTQTDTSSATPLPSTYTPKELHQWLDKNSQTMSSFSATDQNELQEFTSKLKSGDFFELSKIAKDPKQSANKRTLAIYMMGSTEAGALAVSDFLKSDFSLQENAQAHSLDEVSNGREKALRVMSIEQLIASAKSPDDARQKLNKLIPTLENPWLKGFTERKRDELP